MSEQNKNSHSAFTILEILLVIFIVGFLVAIAIPSFTGNHHTSPANACINYMRQIDAAANQFALENHLTNGDTISFPNDLTPYIKLNREGKIPSCPSGGIYRDSQKIEGDKPLMAPTCSLGTTVTPAHVLP